MDSVLQWVLSIQSAIMLWLMGNGSKIGPAVGLFGQTVWIAYALRTKQYGLIPGIAMFTVVHSRNLAKLWTTKR